MITYMRILTEKLDEFHMGVDDLRAIDGYAKPFNLVLSAREWGKTTCFELLKIFATWMKTGKKSIRQPWTSCTALPPTAKSFWNQFQVEVSR